MNRCLLVSNRLPVAFNEKRQEFTPSSGGLVSAIRGLDPEKIGYDFEWMGIMTDDIDQERIQELRKTSFGDIKCHPISVPHLSYDYYYNKYCNNVIWPLFHYERSHVQHSAKGWKYYQEVNQLVANAIISEAKENDTIWIHDFHLLLVPGFVKEKRPSLKLGFFLHIPFPSSEIFRELPQRKQILSSLLQCDLVGFHDLSYLTHFKTSVQRISGECPSNTSERKWGVYPISIDSKNFENLAVSPHTLEFVEKYKKSKKDIKWILGVDRLDYIKGLILKLRAFRVFLKNNPEHIGKVQMIQIVIPSRTDVPEYLHLKERVEQVTSSINGEFGNPTYMPVNYLFHSVSDNELSALYQVSDVLHIGSRRDGMNLVSLEYVVSQTEKEAGNILISEFAGAHSTLSYAFSINPWDVQDTAIKMKEALIEPQEVKNTHMSVMKNFLQNYTSSDWAKVFLRDLHREQVHTEKIIRMSASGTFQWMHHLKNKKVLFFCDLDGTLLPIAGHPSQVTMSKKTTCILQKFSLHKECQFVIVSGRDKEFLQNYFIKDKFNFSMAACHGAYSYSNKDHEWLNMVPLDSGNWKEQVLEVLKLYTLRTPGSFIEYKGHAITWHYRASPHAFAEFLANKLYIELEEGLTSQPVQVSHGKKIIEVKSIHANKGVFVQQWIGQIPLEHKPDVIVAIGDDTTDEDMFFALQEQKSIKAFCIKIGDESTHAHFAIRDQEDVNQFLENFLDSVGS